MIIDRTPFAQMLRGPNADIEMRGYYESLRAMLQTEQSTWLPHWSQLSRFFLPRNQRFTASAVDRGQRMDGNIMDNTPTMALRTLGAGMMSGMSSPTREWFKVKTDDEQRNKLAEVEDYLEHGADAVRTAFLKSNFYPTLHRSYLDLGLYGTQAFSLMEDQEDDIRCYPFPIGSYYLSGSSALRIDLTMRVVSMTARQIVADYGIDKVSKQVRTAFESRAGGAKEQWFQIVHVLHPNTYFGDEGKRFAPWISAHYEMGQDSMLRRAGFQENPIIASRWDVTGENIYGNSPAMDALGDAMALQMKEQRKSEAIDKMVKPPMIASPAMANGKMSILPGDITFGDMKDSSMGFKPAFEMKFDVAATSADMEQVRHRIDEAMYKTLFLMISGSDRREVTAEEIRAKQEEKMLVLGPVLERCNSELFQPAIMRTWAILRRRGKIGPPPAIMRGRPAQFQFESILAQAQRMMKIAALDRFSAFVGGQAAVNPDALDIVDSDETNREYADALSVPAKCLRSPDDVAKIRKAKAQAQQQAQMAQNASKLAPAAQALSQTDTTSDNGLTRMLSTVGQPGVGI